MNKLMYEQFNRQIKDWVKKDDYFKKYYDNLDDPKTYKVDYEEFLDNYDNPRWIGWFFLREMSKTWYNYNSFRTQTWYEHCKNFLNSYLFETYVQRVLNLKFLGGDHLYLGGGYGKNIPDFVDDMGHSVEVKNCYSYLSYLDRLAANEINWHNAEVRYLYVREERKLYRIDNTTNKPIRPEVARFAVPRVWFDYSMFE